MPQRPIAASTIPLNPRLGLDAYPLHQTRIRAFTELEAEVDLNSPYPTTQHTRTPTSTAGWMGLASV